MKLLCVILDMLAVAFLGVLVINNGMPSRLDDQICLALAFALMLLNTFTVIRCSDPKDPSLLRLYLRRKMLEEKAKISAFEKTS